MWVIIIIYYFAIKFTEQKDEYSRCSCDICTNFQKLNFKGG